MTDPYATLEVGPDADDSAIRSAYRKLAKKYHPDVNPGDKAAEEKFKAISKAYDLLGDKEKRGRFDRGEIDAEGNPTSPFGAGGSGFGGGAGGFGGFGGGGGSFNVDPEEMASMFGDLFGQGGGRARGGFGGFGGGRRGPSKGGDARASITIPFMLAATGGSHEIMIDGSPVKISIPAGLEDGKVLRLKGKGQPAPMRGIPAGDLLLTIHVAKDPAYTREGRNLRKVQDITLAEAVLGGKAEVNTPQGTVRVSIKPGSDSGTILRLKGRGIGADKTHPAGDLLVVLQVKIGEASEALKEFLEKEQSKKAE